jgi:hypothetical protein
MGGIYDFSRYRNIFRAWLFIIQTHPAPEENNRLAFLSFY